MMINMTLENIAKACGGEYRGNQADTTKLVEGIVIDSRKIKNNYLFIATKGERVDGHSFLPQVFANGAICAVCEQPSEVEGKPYILVEDTFLALRQIAAFYRTQLSAKIVGVTGSVGKTSTKEFIATVLEEKYKVLKTKGNYNNEIGLPLTVLEITSEHEIAVLEMGINHFGEMERLGEIARPDIAVITNIGQCHLEFLETREGILKAKTEMLPYIKEDGMLCINGDDDMLATIPVFTDKEKVSFGLEPGNTVVAKEIQSNGLFGSVCKIATKEEECKVEIPVSGQHMIYNALAATAVALRLGLTFSEIASGISKVSSVSGRSNLIAAKDKVIIDDCYNANPVSMKAAIELLLLSQTRKVAVLGDMGELGENEQKMHEEIGCYAIEKKIDVLVCVGEISENMAEAARKCKEVNQTLIYYFKTIEEAIEEIPKLLMSDDTILVKASHFMQFERIVKALSE